MAKDKEKKQKRRKRISPNQGDEIDHQLADDGYEMDSVDEMKKNNKQKSKAVDKFRQAVAKNKPKENVLNLIANLKTSASRWKQYATSRRAVKSSGAGENDRRKTGGLGLDYEMASVAHDDVDGGKSSAKNHMMIAHNRNLVEYFARVGQSKDAKECIDLEYVANILSNGANINCTDKYGQTIFHEVARAWHTDVAQFLLENGADINKQDNYGRSPLHVAAAVDYADMVNFLIDKNAEKEIRTKGEKQSPVHFAARNDACNSLRALIRCGCLYKDVRDYKGRTPLHVAAELDRSETARLLLELDDPAPAGVEDDSGQSAIVWMIIKMPPVAKIALDQFHTTDRANRKQFYHLNNLEPRKPGTETDTYPQTALQVIVAYRRLDLITHPATNKLCSVKWRQFARSRAFIQLLLNFAFIMAWTLQGILVDYELRYNYILPEEWWRIFIFLLAIVFTGWQLKDELSEFFNSRKNHQRWKKWREAELERDQEFTHPRWPEEQVYLMQELDDLDSMRPQYFNDFWNIFDWVCYMLLLVSIVTHIVDIFDHTHFVARLHIRIMAITVIQIWLRLLKNARAFSYLGPFIVMLTHMMSDVLRFAFLYLEFYIPFACAFWMLFGGDKTPEEFQGLPDAKNQTVTVQGMHDFNALLFSLFRLTLVDDYDYDGMKQVDSIMADILIGAWLALSAILMLNLFIALLSDTFQRVYDNAQANAVMQKAITILNIEEGLSKKRRDKFRTYIHGTCSPKIEFYDDDAADSGEADLKKVTIQIKDQLDELQENYFSDMRPKPGEQKNGQKQATSSSSSFFSANKHTNREQLDGMEDDLREGKYQQGHDHNDLDYNHHNESDDDNTRRRGGGGKRGGGGDDDEDDKPGGGGGGGDGRTQRKPGVTVEKFESEIDLLRDEIQGLKVHQEDLMEGFREDLDDIKSALHHLVSASGRQEPPPPPATMQLPLSHVSPMHPGGDLRHSMPLARPRMETDWDRMERERVLEMNRLRSQLGVAPLSPPNLSVDVNNITVHDGGVVRHGVELADTSHVFRPSTHSDALVQPARQLLKETPADSSQC